MEDAKIPEDMLAALNEFNSVAEEILTPFIKQLESQEPPQFIYHYTTDVGLKGILETGQLWLTDIFNLNDPSEMRHGVSHAVDILNNKSETGPPESRVFAKHFRNFHQLGMESTAHYFVGCFSSDGDELGQWRAYADNGRGYALGFDTKGLEDVFTKADDIPIANNCTFSVTYDDVQLANLHRQLIEKMFELISLPRGKKLENSQIAAYLRDLSVYLSLPVLRAALFFKHEAYKNEREYRFLQIYAANEAPPEVKRRYRSYELVKYREFNWRQLRPEALKQIIVGPAADRSKASRFAADCLAAFHSGEVEIVPSRIPYRVP